MGARQIGMILVSDLRGYGLSVDLELRLLEADKTSVQDLLGPFLVALSPVALTAACSDGQHVVLLNCPVLQQQTTTRCNSIPDLGTSEYENRSRSSNLSHWCSRTMEVTV